MDIGALRPTNLVSQDTEETPKAPEGNRKIQKYAQEFEASLLSAWWKEMQSSLTSPDQEQSEFGSMNDLAAQALGVGLSAHGGIGIAKMIVHQFESGRVPMSSEKPNNVNRD
jgi:Rod binding domain-containing protein